MGMRELTQLSKAFKELSENGEIYIDDTPARNVMQIAASARRIKRRRKIGLLMIDYIQLVDSDATRDSRQEQIAKISRRLKSLARELHVPIVALSQLNRAVESREDKRPRMADLRESGANRTGCGYRPFAASSRLLRCQRSTGDRRAHHRQEP